MSKSLDEIRDNAPKLHGQQWAFVGLECLFWTTDARHLGKLSDFGEHALDESCCPFCGGAIKQELLDIFVENAIANEASYGAGGLGNLVAAHYDNARTCRVRWERYEVKIR